MDDHAARFTPTRVGTTGGRYAPVIRAARRLRDVWESGGFEYVDLAEAVQAVVDALREAEGEVEI